MSRRPVLIVTTFAVLSSGALGAQPAPGPPGVRVELDGLRLALERAVGGVMGRAMLPHAPSHAYHLKGYGAVIVLSPRLLAEPRLVRRVIRGDEAAGADIVPADVARAMADAQREFAHDMAALQEQGVPTVEFPMIDIGDLEREMEQQMAAQAAAMRQFDLDQQEWTRQREEVLRQQIRAVEEQAEAFREAAERARVEAERSVRQRLVARPRVVVEVAEPPDAPAAPIAPEAAATPATAPAPAAVSVPAPAPPAPAMAGTVRPAAAAPPAPPAPAAMPEPADAPPPPWRFWFDTAFDDDAPLQPAAPGPVLAAARDALAVGLESYPRKLVALGPDEFVSVAVDFVPDRGPRARVTRTLIARVRVRDLNDRQAGRLAPADLRRRIEYDEE